MTRRPRTRATTARVCLDLTPGETLDRLGGIGRYALALGRALLALPPERTAGIELLGLARSDGAPAALADALDDAARDRPLVHATPHRFRRRTRVSAALRAARVDLFHATHPMSLPLAPGCPIVVTVHDLVRIVLPPPGPRGRLDALVHRARGAVRVRQAARLVAPSETTRRDLVRELGADPERIDVTPLGVDGARFSAEAVPGERERFALPPRYFVAVASDHYRKNQARLVEAYLRADAQVPESLVIVGRALYGGALDALLAGASGHGASRIAWRADVSDEELCALYRHATATVHPSLYEGFGLTLLESMACGAPVLAARNGAYDEVGGDAARYFDPRDTQDLVLRLVQLSGDAPLRAALRDAGLRRAREATWERTACATVGAWRKVLG